MSTSDDLQDKDIARICSMVYARCGIQLEADRKEFFRARLGQRLRARSLNNFRDYMQIFNSPKADEELEALIDVMTTHFTSFFREPEAFSFLREIALPQLFRAHRPLNFWSAAASTGQEIWSIRVEVADTQAKLSHSGIVNFLGTDVSSSALKTAQSAIYPMKELQTIPQDRLQRYFLKGVGPYSGKATIRPELRTGVSFQQMNILNANPTCKEWDIIFVRNVMIYFDIPTRESLVSRLTSLLRPGGWLIIGSSESLFELKHSLVQLKPTVYQRRRA